MNYLEILNKNENFIERKEYSINYLDKIKKSTEGIDIIKTSNISLFVAGSLGRMEFGKKSDVDFFVITENNISRLIEIEILGKLIHLNKELGLPGFSNDGKFLKVYSLNDMINKTGSPIDDHENYFTTRLLMILESKVILNDNLYNIALKKIIGNYFKDKEDHPDFFPIYLINDIVRYWRTLCLNYEMIRFDNKKPWRKKNINLKYSRMLTVFATILPLLVISPISEEEMLNIIKLSPQERLALGLNKLSNNDYLLEYEYIINIYESFLKAKEDDDIDKNIELKKNLDKNADEFSMFLYKILMDEKINLKYKKYLVI